MDNRSIGVFDSGLGGLTVVRELLARLPHENVVYFGDTGRVPYGTNSPETIARYAAQDCRFLRKYDVKCIVAACGTVSTTAPAVLAEQPVFTMGVLEPAADAALAATRGGRIGVLGTSATVRSRAFETYLRQAAEVQVFSQACPLFVSLVENGWIERDNEATLAVARRYLQPLREQRVDTVILGCTHFPLLKPIIADVLGEDVVLIDAGAACAARCEQHLREQDALCGRETGGDYRFFVSDRPQGFAQVAQMFLGRAVEGDIHRVEPEEFG